MDRTIETLLSIISVIINVFFIGLFTFFIFVMFISLVDPTFEEEIFYDYYDDPDYSLAEAKAETQFDLKFMKVTTGMVWIFLLSLLVSVVLSIVGIVKVKNKPIVAGILFTAACILSGFMSPSGILLLIVAILCFTRKSNTLQQQ